MQPITDNKKVLNDFQTDISHSLSQTPKYINSKWFYNAEGDALYNAITEQPEYYLTESEKNIISQNALAIAEKLSQYRKKIHLIELGPGDGSKIPIIIDALLDSGLSVRYAPLDISEQVVKNTANALSQTYPDMAIDGIIADFRGQWHVETYPDELRLVVFLGSTIGNFPKHEWLKMAEEISNNLQSGDFVLIGFDLLKDVSQILPAYSDAAGYTSAFNLNLLKRINTELGGQFILHQFEHFVTFNTETGDAESYLRSVCQQEVFVEALNTTFYFSEGELLFTEISHKFKIDEINQVASTAKANIIATYTDGLFQDTLFQKY
jgi:L-histidine Nalpha-methyltransferase